MTSVRQMRSSGLIVLLLLFLLFPLIISSARAKSPQRIPQMAANVLLPDGSFEQTPSLWTERDSTRCTPWIGDWSVIDGFPTAFDGSRYFWAGGECGPPNSADPNSNNVRQTITVQPIDTTLSFWYYALRTDDDSNVSDDYAYIQFNGVEVWRLDMTQANNTTGWVNATLNISSYAGQNVNLKVGGVNGSRAGVGNVFFDFFEITQDQISEPAIEIVKGPDTQTIGLNETAVFNIAVTNTGNTTLFDIQVTDPLTPNCNQNLEPLGAGESTSYPCQRNNVSDSFTNTATVTGKTNDLNPVTDSDTADVIVNNPGIAINVSPATQTIADNGTAAFTITLTNTGNINLTNINVSSPTTPTCDNTLPSLSAQTTHTFPVCTRTNVTQSYLNTVAVTANTGSGNITAGDTAFVDVIDSQIAIVITPDEQTVRHGDDATFDIFVFNIGDNDLSDVQITSEAGPACNNTFVTLAEGAHTSYTCTLTDIQEAFTHAISVQATNLQAALQVQDTDIAVVHLLDISVQTTAAPTVLEAPGGNVSFEIVLTNSGSKALTLDVINATIYSSQTDPNPTPIQNSSCDMGRPLPVSAGSYQCAFDVPVSGSVGNYNIEINVTTSDTDGNAVVSTTTTDITIIKPPIQTVFLPTILNNYVYSEPNNSCGDAFLVATNTAYDFLADDIDDWYLFELSTAADLRLELTNFFPIDGQITAWSGPCNAPVFLGHNGDFSATKILSLGNQPAGIYRIWIINDGATNIMTPYQLKVVTTP